MWIEPIATDTSAARTTRVSRRLYPSTDERAVFRALIPDYNHLYAPKIPFLTPTTRVTPDPDMTITVLAPRTTETKRRKPLKAIDMVTSQAPARPPPSVAGATGRDKGKRTSARLGLSQEGGEENARSGDKKRKAGECLRCGFGLGSVAIGALHADFRGIGFDEDVEGFQFTRITSKKTRPSADAISKLDPATQNPAPQQSPRRGRPRKRPLGTGIDGAGDTRGESPGAVVEKPMRANTTTPAKQQTPPQGARITQKHTEPTSVEKKRKRGRPAKSKQERNGYASPEPQQTGTAKISLPMADTPVMQRNKEMRTKRSEKGSRRSSLGMRGRRASSLIDSGTSNGECPRGNYIGILITTLQLCRIRRSTRRISTSTLRATYPNREECGSF